MPRKGEVPKREILGDPVYHSHVLQHLINKMIVGGKKGLAERIVYGALMEIAEKSGDNPLDVFATAIQNIKPVLEVRPRRVGGATYQVPVEVAGRRQLTLAIRWLVDATRNRNERVATTRLANELMEAARGEGGAVRKRTDIYRMAEANKAYAHYRW
jgi:small subunit ribosomal protein S7